MRIMVVGCGSIGKRHLGNLRHLSAGELIAYDSSQERLAEVSEKYGVKVSSDFDEAMLQNPQAVLVCTPTSLHTKYALAASRQGCHLFIEKPISHSMDGIDELTEMASARGLVILVGCNFRFHWGLKLLKKLLHEGAIGKLLYSRANFGQYLPDWHPQEDYRQGYSANTALGGGIILDAIHEIDYLQWLIGKIDSVTCFSGKLSSLDIDTEDTAEILFRSHSGIIGNVHMDYIRRDYNRSCELIGEEGTLTWSFQDNQVKLYTAGAKNWQTFQQETPDDINAMYIAEMEHFLLCIEGKETPALSAEEAIGELKIVLAAKESSRNGKAVSL